MGLMSALFGGSKTQQVSKYDSDQLNYQKAVMGQGYDIMDTEAQSQYAGDMAQQNLTDVIQGMEEQRTSELAQSNIMNRLHSSGRGARQSRINKQYNQAINNMKYQHNLQQQNWKQAYDQKAQDWNLSGKYSSLMGLSSIGMAQRYDTVVSQTPGLFDAISAVGGAVGSIGGAISSFGSGKPSK